MNRSFLVCDAAELDAVADLIPHFELIELAAGADAGSADALVGSRSGPGAGSFYLRSLAGVLMLCRIGDPHAVHVEPREIEQRLKGSQLLGRAVGTRRGQALEVLDATCGLGLDGLALARRGQRVTLVERHPLLWALATNLLRRAGIPSATLRLGNSRALLEDPKLGFDVICIDPMFPARAKTALPGKRMQYLAELLRGEPDFDAKLIDLARHRARSRVVLKRRRRDPSVGQPDWTITGRSVRYDVYRGRG